MEGGGPCARCSRGPPLLPPLPRGEGGVGASLGAARGSPGSRPAGRPIPIAVAPGVCKRAQILFYRSAGRLLA
eukprot:14889421-Alexandrium_andersonii.AAC.1